MPIGFIDTFLYLGYICLAYHRGTLAFSAWFKMTISGLLGREPHRGFVDVARGFIPLCRSVKCYPLLNHASF